ncbi:MAG: purine nucleoside phosphorylase I, inosine and guanosine-specific [Bacteroidales bacterium]|jgi:purine-nucleoside phosphorylase|nr:purine nucleoside phosphorylase I, inosine and guanosine-specific [Bacteroidales bacterium]
MNSLYEKISAAADYVKGRTGGKIPLTGIILGSGLGNLGDSIEDKTIIPYREIPGFAVSTAIGHKGNLITGRLGGKDVIAMQGRFHYYEGYSMEEVTFPVRVLKKLGIKYLFVSNAAGGVNFDFKLGDIMVIKDHINMLPNPLIGKNMDEFGPRFPDMTHTYDRKIISMAFGAASDLGIVLKEGVYLAGTGPSYETPSEYKFFRTIGADAIGMSTIPEVIVARHSGLRVFGVSVITNEAHDDYAPDYVNNGDEVVKVADAAAKKLTLLFTDIIKGLE